MTTSALDALDVALAAALGLLIAASMWSATVPATACALLCALLGAVRLVLRHPGEAGPTPHVLDAAVAVVVAVEGASLAFSRLPSNSLYGLHGTLLCAVLYGVVRFTATQPFQRAVLLIVPAGLGSVLTVFAARDFLARDKEALALGFTCIADFRSLMRFGAPPGMPFGAWASVFLALIPFAVAVHVRAEGRIARTLSWIAAASLCIVTLSTFLRGLYAGLAAFVALAGLLTYRFVRPRRRLLLGLVTPPLAALAVVVATPARAALLTALGARTSASFQLSATGRLELWSGVVHQLPGSPWFGIGSGNLAGLTPRLNPSRDVPYFSQAFSAPLQIAMENGPFGLLAYGLLVAGFLRITWRRMKALPASAFHERATTGLLGAGVCALLVRDLSYSSLLVNPGSAALAALMMALNGQAPAPAPAGRGARTAILFVVTAAAALLLAQLPLRHLRRAEAHLGTALLQLDRGRLDGADAEIEEALRLTPRHPNYWAHKGLILAARAEVAWRTGSGGLGLVAAHPEYAEQALAAYEKASSLGEHDYLYHHNRGSLLWAEGRVHEAAAAYRRAIEQEGRDPLPHVSLGLLSEMQQDRDAACAAYARALSLAPSLVRSAFFRDLGARSAPIRDCARHEAIARLRRRSATALAPVDEAKLGTLVLDDDEREGLDRLSSASAALPNLSRPWYHLGRAAGRGGQEDVACRDYARAVWLDPTYAEAWLENASCLERAQRPSEAAEAYGYAVRYARERSSEHARRVGRLYRSATALNDVVPQNLLPYCAPIVDIDLASSRRDALCARAPRGARPSEPFE